MPGIQRFPRMRLVIVSALAWTCGGSGIAQSLRLTIPENASGVRLVSALQPRGMYDAAYGLLRQHGFRLREADEQGLKLATESKGIGTSRTEVRLTLRIEPRDGGSTLAASGEFYPPKEGDWRQIQFSQSDTKARVAFEEMVLLIGQLPNLQIEYSGDRAAP